MNKHHHSEQQQRFIPEGASVPMREGCYVSDRGGFIGSTRDAADIAYGVGAITSTEYAQMCQRLTIDNVDVEDVVEISDRTVEALNNANTTTSHGWEWFDGELWYMPIEWFES